MTQTLPDNRHHEDSASSKKSDHDNKKSAAAPAGGWLALVALGSFVILVWFFSGVIVYLVGIFSGNPGPGQIGDMFGAVNALFSGLAFAGVITALFLQRKELSLQREELGLTRDQFERAAEAQERLAKIQEYGALFDVYTRRASYLQRFENAGNHGVTQDEVSEKKRELKGLVSKVDSIFKEIKKLEPEILGAQDPRDVEEKDPEIDRKA